jgi:hypothetical protein
MIDAVHMLCVFTPSLLKRIGCLDWSTSVQPIRLVDFNQYIG